MSRDVANGLRFPDGSILNSTKVTVWAASTAVKAYALVVLPTGGLGYQTADRTTRASWDATERDFWTFLPGGHYEKFTASGTWKVPAGITQCRTRITGAGAGGGGGGSAALTAGTGSQIGASGGSAGAVNEIEVTGLTPGASQTVTVGAGSAGAAGGAASTGVTGNAGAIPAAGGRSSIVLAGTTYVADGGFPGIPSAANSTAAVQGGAQGSGQSNVVFALPASFGAPGAGGSSAIPGTWSGPVCGGCGGASATATKGGIAGNVCTDIGKMVNYMSLNGTAPTLAGGDGTAQTIPGCGGVGGGGGAPGGRGGNGGNGGNGLVEVWY